jgi:hypothetical protein
MKNAASIAHDTWTSHMLGSNGITSFSHNFG